MLDAKQQQRLHVLVHTLRSLLKAKNRLAKCHAIHRLVASVNLSICMRTIQIYAACASCTILLRLFCTVYELT